MIKDMRALALAAAAFLFFIGGIVAQVLAADLTIRPDIAVDGEAVRLDQLFDGVTEGGETIVAPAPEPGEKLVLDAGALEKIAVRHRLAWQPEDSGVTATITRATRQIEYAEIEALVAGALSERLLSSEFEIELTDDWPSLATAAGSIEGPHLFDLKLDTRSGRFAAQIGATRSVSPNERVKIAGRLVRTEAIPVPGRAIGADEVIKSGDIEWRRFRVDRLGQNPVVSVEAIVGKTPRRALKPGQPVRASDLAAPLIVEKGAPVTMVFAAPGIQLIMIGRALESGAEGQWIRVLNPQSKMTTYGAVAADGSVLVTAGAPAGQVVLGSEEGE